VREVLDRVARAASSPENPTVVVTGSGSRYFLRQIVEGSIPNLAALSHNEIPAGVKVMSLGVIQ
jgi:flagellar biosynthesis component FlhA